MQSEISEETSNIDITDDVILPNTHIQKIGAKPGDKILVIIGVGHMNILNPLFDVSPEFKLLNTNEYLK